VRLLLAADVGATKVDLGVFSPRSGPRSPLASTTVPTARYPSLGALVAEFLSRTGLKVDGAVFAVAGPVQDGRVDTLGLPWPVDGDVLRASIPVADLLLLNDLEATAGSVPFLRSDDVVTLRQGTPREGGAIAVVAAGTGLGEAFLISTASGYVACESEGGHASFAPTSTTEIELLGTLRHRLDHVSYETVCSGAALPDLHAFVRATRDTEEPAWLSERLAAEVDGTPVIVEAALSGRAGTEACVGAVELLVSILGAEAGNLALKVMATGGVYLGGGIPPRILPLLRQGQFLKSLGSKGPDSGFLAEVPVHVITNTSAGLFGAAWSGLEAMSDIPASAN
jgi:glucokinase